MKTYRNFYFVLGIILIIFILFFIFQKIIFKPASPPLESDELKLLKQVFPKESIVVKQKDQGYYIINGKDYYVKSIGDVNRDGFLEFVSMGIVQGQGKTYEFYTKTANDYLLIGREESLIWHFEDKKNEKMEFILKDITGDDISEFLIPILTSASGVTPYHIFVFDNETKKLKNIFSKSYFSKKPEISIVFDEIRRDGNFVVTVSHGGYSKTKSYYLFEEDILNFEKSIGVYGEPGVSGEYEYREIDKNGDIVYKEKRKGNLWLDESIK